jgi:hypothetical protein
MAPTRSVQFFPAEDGRGKWHAAERITDTPICGTPVVLDTTAMPIIGTCEAPGGGRPYVYKAHPLACRRCLRLAGSLGYAPRAR